MLNNQCYQVALVENWSQIRLVVMFKPCRKPNQDTQENLNIILLISNLYVFQNSKKIIKTITV